MLIRPVSHWEAQHGVYSLWIKEETFHLFLSTHSLALCVEDGENNKAKSLW